MFHKVVVKCLLMGIYTIISSCNGRVELRGFIETVLMIHANRPHPYRGIEEIAVRFILPFILVGLGLFLVSVN